MRVTATQYFIVQGRITGGEYLAARRIRSNLNQPAYRWSKTARNSAYRFATYDAAQKAGQRYGGSLVRCVKVRVGDQKVTVRQAV